MASAPWIELSEDLELKPWEVVDPATNLVMPATGWDERASARKRWVNA